MYKTLFLIFFLFYNQVAAQETIIVTTIKPLASIISNITKNTNQKVISLVGKNDSPHNYHLRPNDAQQISQATLVFYIANNLETFMDKVAKNNTNTIELISQVPGLNLLPYRHLHFNKIEHEHSEHHHDHIHEGTDPHIWLDVYNSEKIAEFVAETLSNIFPSDKEQYQINLSNFLIKTSNLKKKLDEQLSAYSGYKYISFHDAYQYLDKQFNLKFMGEIMLNAQIAPNSNRILELRKIIYNNSISCIFSEPQFNNRIIDTLINNSNIKTAELDAEWGGNSNLNISESYFAMMENLGYNIAKCLNTNIRNVR